MKPPSDFERIIKNRRYSVRSSVLIAGDDNSARKEQNTFLYRTFKGRYFLVTVTRQPGEENQLQPVSVEEGAFYFKELLYKHRFTYEEAFSGIEDA